MELRAYQLKALRAVLFQWRTVRRTLLVLPTGTGKTVVFSHLTKRLADAGKRVLILAHREELIDQAIDKLHRATGIFAAKEMAQHRATRSAAAVVASVQTMTGARLQSWPADHFDVVIIDEAHHTLASSYMAIVEHFGDARLLGVTATPDRGDKKGLGQVYESIAYQYRLGKAIKDGYLSPVRALTLPLKIDVAKVKTQAGDFSARDAGDALAPYLDQIADAMATHCAGRRTVAFLPLIQTSQTLAHKLRLRGLRVAEVNGKSADRREVLDDFGAGRYDVLCNSMLLTEGWDEPSVDCIVCLRPTRIRALYAQIVGRGMRLHPGKDHLRLIDFLWHTDRHSLCRPGSLIGENDLAERMATDNVGEEVDLLEGAEEAERSAVEERESKLARELAALKHRKKRLVDPLQYAISICDTDLADYAPAFGWEREPMTEAQRNALDSAGIDHEAIDTKGHASAIMDTLTQRRESGLATPKQVRLLEQRGFAHVGTWTFERASAMISRLAQNNWRVTPLMRQLGA